MSEKQGRRAASHARSAVGCFRKTTRRLGQAYVPPACATVQQGRFAAISSAATSPLAIHSASAGNEGRICGDSRSVCIAARCQSVSLLSRNYSTQSDRLPVFFPTVRSGKNRYFRPSARGSENGWRAPKFSQVPPQTSCIVELFFIGARVEGRAATVERRRLFPGFPLRSGAKLWTHS